MANDSYARSDPPPTCSAECAQSLVFRTDSAFSRLTALPTAATHAIMFRHHRHMRYPRTCGSEYRVVETMQRQPCGDPRRFADRRLSEGPRCPRRLFCAVLVPVFNECTMLKYRRIMFVPVPERHGVDRSVPPESVREASSSNTKDLIVTQTRTAVVCDGADETKALIQKHWRWIPPKMKEK